LKVKGLNLNFILIGMPGSGKTTLGKKAAAALGMRFYDTDISASDHIRSELRSKPQAEGQTTSLFFHFMHGFVAAEKAVVHRIATEAVNAIIATGAETALSPDNVRVLRPAGRFIYIKRDPDLMLKEIRERFIPDPKNPKIRDGNELMVYAYKDTLPKYESLADFTVENDGDFEASLEKLVNIIREEIARMIP
jgi:shikimate kinase